MCATVRAWTLGDKCSVPAFFLSLLQYLQIFIFKLETHAPANTQTHCQIRIRFVLFCVFFFLFCFVLFRAAPVCKQMCVICFSFAVSGHALADMCGKKAFYHCQCCGRCCCCRTPNTLNSFAHTFRGRFVCSAAALFFFSKNNFYHLNLFLW